MTVSRAVVLVFLAVIITQPATLLIASHYHMEAPFKSADELAAIMGAIFTVGGLMVALVAFVTVPAISMSQIQIRIP